MVRFDTPESQWFPKVLWVGVGCGRLTPRSLIETAIQQVLQRYNLGENAIAGIATLDQKGNETRVSGIVPSQRLAITHLLLGNIAGCAGS
ncbi:MAG: cobalamin biosynthesis protein [Planktothrix sp. GU0601_MAG3]|nr:MAG: cobalamin biosynthesis protein [Planktothrix sp. GU0601_MAG3]